MTISRQKLLLVREETFEYNKAIKNTRDIFTFVKEILKVQDEAQEVCYVITLDTKNKIVGFTETARGAINMCNISLSQIFKNVLLSNCEKFIVLHNHPSGDATPSKQDIEITKHILESAKLLGMQMLDHVIVGNEDFQSCMKEIER